jgi:hypothetical protein
MKTRVRRAERPAVFVVLGCEPAVLPEVSQAVGHLGAEVLEEAILGPVAHILFRVRCRCRGPQHRHSIALGDDLAFGTYSTEAEARDVIGQMYELHLRSAASAARRDS